MKKIIALILVMAIFCPSTIYADENQAVTRLAAVHMLEELLPQHEVCDTFDDCHDQTVAYYKKLGIVSPLEDNNFWPNQMVTTQDFLLMLKRTLDAACPDLFYDNQKIIWHRDQNEIDDYAKNQIAMVSAIGVYNNSGMLKPKSIISEGMARYYIKLGKVAMNHGKRSKNGVKPVKKRPPALMYHQIEEPREPYSYLYVSPEHFEEQIKYLYDNGYTFLFPEEISLADEIPKSVVITFDDGYETLYYNALPILKKYNAKATVYAIGDMIGQPYYCTREQLREMSDSNAFRVYSHTVSHLPLSELSAEELEHEFRRGNDVIHNITKREVTSIAYPFGDYNDLVIWQARRFYKNAFTVDMKGGTSMHDITRATIDDTLTIEQFAKRVR